MGMLLKICCCRILNNMVCLLSVQLSRFDHINILASSIEKVEQFPSNSFFFR